MVNNNEEITYFARTNYRNQNKKFGIKLDDRRRHMYVLGKTGVGKTTLLKNMIIQDIDNGHGLAYIDPHGDDVQEVLECIPAHRTNDVIYFNPADLSYPIAFNILENINPDYKHLVSDGLMGVFTKIWANMWSARMEYILRNCILALLDSPGNTLLGIMRLLVDKEFRRKIVEKIQDPVVKTFWVEEYANYNERFRTEAIAPIQNKVGQFLSSAVIRNIVGQPKSTIDIRDFMDNDKVLLMNLSKGKIGEDNSNLLGAMMITKIQLAAMSRVDITEAERSDFFLYVDEMQNFVTESFADILSEARKYHLGLILSHQYIAQLSTPESTKVRDAVFGNVGTIVCFRVGADDAKFLIKEFEPYLTEEDLVNINNREIYLKLMIDGVNSRPFSASTLAPFSIGRRSDKTAEKVIKVSRERYANPREEVEEKIMRWLNLDETFKAQAAEGKLAGDEAIFRAKTSSEKKSTEIVKSNKKNVELKAVCDNCGAGTVLSFIPKPNLNIFCKDCLKKFKDGKIDVAKLTFHNSELFANLNQNKPAPTETPPVITQVKEVSLTDLNRLAVEEKSAQPQDLNPGQRVKL
ncbi:MAG TPA: type IV secretion system DNA-binding domain-containing protein [bacterium]|nr:type IV secretion system DNA-binding domain-containing protein [bacterium]HPL95201.1 type IV secretion system DNA-binding domain-containing protein [bacterium]